MISSAERIGLKGASEVFADRSYQSDGSLTPRDRPGALIDDPSVAAKQALQMVKDAEVTTMTGETIPMKAETICIHGDGPHALDFATTLRKVFDEHNVTVGTIG